MMRDPDRLDDFYDKLKEIHKREFPDWRFGQLMVNFLSAYGDPFYWEENTFMKKFELYCQQIKTPNEKIED